MSRRRKSERRRARGSRGPTALAGSSGWLYASARPATPDKPAGTAAHARPSVGPTLGSPELPDPLARAGILEVPIVDWTEGLPSCH